MRFFVISSCLVALLAACGGSAPRDHTPTQSMNGGHGVISDAEAGATQTERTMRMAEKALAEGKPEMAAVFYRTAALADPTNPKPRQASAALFETTNEHDAAAALYQQLARESKDPELWLDAGRNYLKASKASEASRAYQEAIDLNPKEARGYNGLAVSYDLRQDHAMAQRNYEKAFDLADDKLQNGILVNWGLSLMLSGEAGVAVQKLEPAVRESDLPSLRQTLALAYGLSGRIEDAKALGLANPPTYDELKATVKEYGMAGPAANTPAAAPVGDVVTVPAKRR